MFDLESSIKKWLKSFSKYRSFDHGSVREMELHLRDHIDDLISEGMSEEEAFHAAVEQFGDIQPVARDEYSILKRKPSIRSLLHIVLLRNYLKTTGRSLMKNPTSSFINIFGIAVAIGICLVVYSFLQYDYSIDQFHKHGKEVYLTTFFVDRDGSLEQNGTTPRPLGKSLKEDYPQISRMSRIEDRNMIVKFEENVFHERVRLVDPDFLNMFTFPLKWGNPNALRDLNSVILSEEMSIKYFGDFNPVGNDILLIFPNGTQKVFRVAGVAEPFPEAHIIEFSFLANFQNIQEFDAQYNEEDWSQFLRATLIQVQDPSDLQQIREGMDKYQKIQNEAEEDWAITGFNFIPIHDLHNRSNEVRNDISYNDSREGRVFLPIIAFLMMALACFNYINMAIVSAAKRLKEIGVRKVIGASRSKIIFQFLSENVLVTLIALLVGWVLAVILFMPWFSDVTQRALDLSLVDPQLWLFMLALVLLTGLASGIYPAFYISKFNVIQIFKGTVQFGKKSPITKVLLSIQLALACMLITSAVVFTQNKGFQNAKSWGYNQKQVLYLDIPDLESYDQLKVELEQNPSIQSIAGSHQHMGMGVYNAIIDLPERKYEVNEFVIGSNYAETMGFQLVEGRFFQEDQESEHRSIVVNEFLVRQLGMVDPIGSLMKIDSVQHEIVGVVRNYNNYNFYYEIVPSIFRLSAEEDYKYLVVKVREEDRESAFADLKAQWAQLFPELPFSGGYQEDVWGEFYSDLDTQIRFTSTIAVIAIILAALGLYGLVTLNVAGRIREFSIRKILGAGIRNLTTAISRQYLYLTIGSFLIGIPLSYLFVNALMTMMYPDPMPFNVLAMLLSVLILLTVIIMVIFTQISRVSRSNPVEGLKEE